MQSVHQVPQAAQKSLKMYHINEDYPTSDHSGDKTLQIYTKACFCTIIFECCRELRRGLQSGFLEHHVIVSTTISYKGQGGQKCRGWLSCCYIFLRPAWLWFTLECKSCPLHRANGCGSRVNFASPLDKEVMDGLRPPTAWHSGATSSALKPWNDNAAKSIELNVGSKDTWRQNQAQNWKRVCKKNRGDYSFRVLMHTESFVLSQPRPLSCSIADRMTKLYNPDLKDVTQEND